MLMTSRSSLEEMLESLLRREERPKDAPPALPSRPMARARARLPSSRRSLPTGFKLDVEKILKENEENEGDLPRTKSVGDGSMRKPDAESVFSAGAPWEDRFIKRKLRVWCKLPSGEWDLGTILATSGMESQIQLASGNAIKVSPKEVLPANPEILEGVDDLIQLSYLNLPSILSNLQHRYSRDMIYCKAGPVLIGVNPFKPVHIYGRHFISAYSKKLAHSPHIYETTDAAYNEMLAGTNQSIIISGESGAGKTETAKVVMQYLAALGGGNGIEREVLQTSCILESFGNAKTAQNDNSSRFGKLIEIHFSMTGKISGALIQTSLLEKARVVQIASGERSYHVFYQLCSGAPSDLRERLNIKMANEYDYLNQSGCLNIQGVDDAPNFLKLQEALDIVRISKEDQEGMFGVLAAVLWLGNIAFEVVGEENHVEAVSNKALITAASLMGCSKQELVSVLSIYKIHAGKDNAAKKLTLQQAIDARDALAKFMYSRLFDWLVEQLDKSLEVGKRKTGRSISVLDIYGFESFQKNSFEQFCINYSNEILQQHFNRHLLKLEQEDYPADGIDWAKVDFEDNQKCLDLFEKKPLGILSLLDEESNFPKATDLTFANKLQQHLTSNSCFKRGRGGTFSIRHHAGQVSYDTSGFLEKNKDSLHSAFLHLLLSSSCPLLQLFASSTQSQPLKPFGPSDQSNLDSQKQSATTKFKGQLDKLMQPLENSTPHFILCIKPNTKRLPGVFEKDIVLQQLRCCGILEVVKMARCGYPNRITHQEFSERYAFLLSDKTVSQDPLSMSVAVLKQFKILPESYKVGCKKLYFRTGQIGALEDSRKRVIQSVIALQKYFRGYKARCQFAELKESIQIFIPADSSKQKKKIKHKHKAVLHLQTAVRGWLARRQLSLVHAFERSKIQNANRIEGSNNESTPIKVTDDAMEDLKRQLARAEAALVQKEEENAALRTQLQQYEMRWSQYVAKTVSVDYTLKKLIVSLQISIAASSFLQYDTEDVSTSPEFYDLLKLVQARSQSTQAKLSIPIAQAEVRGDNNNNNNSSNINNNNNSSNNYNTNANAGCSNPVKDTKVRLEKREYSDIKKQFFGYKLCRKFSSNLHYKGVVYFDHRDRILFAHFIVASLINSQPLVIYMLHIYIYMIHVKHGYEMLIRS